MARGAALGLALLLAIGRAALGAAAAAGSDISLSGVAVSVLEAGGSTAETHKVAGPDARLRLVLDHTRTLKVGGGGRHGSARRQTATSSFILSPRLPHTRLSGPAASAAAGRADCLAGGWRHRLPAAAGARPRWRPFAVLPLIAASAAVVT